jgi:hypothetical protein
MRTLIAFTWFFALATRLPRLEQLVEIIENVAYAREFRDDDKVRVIPIEKLYYQYNGQLILQTQNSQGSQSRH